VVVTDVIAGGTTITPTTTKVRGQIAIAVVDAVEADVDVVVKVKESNAITIRNLDIIIELQKQASWTSPTFKLCRSIDSRSSDIAISSK
jgi:hypothetical protein